MQSISLSLRVPGVCRLNASGAIPIARVADPGNALPEIRMPSSHLPTRHRFLAPHLAAVICALLNVVLLASLARAGETLSPAIRTRADAAVQAVLTRTGVPSASIAVVRNHAIVYANAYGWAQLEPRRAATPAMRYAVGSISKEFTATALLLLQEDGRLSIDDLAGKWVTGLGPAAGASIRSLLSHTSGIRDFWPQDYDPPEMLKPVKAEVIVTRWANQPLDFKTGTAWQYSNTGYTVAGMIAEKAAGVPLFQFMQSRIFEPLAMASVVDFDAGPLSGADASGYTRYALGPPRPAAKEGRGWLFAAGQLAMTASDLARWDIALIERRVLSAASYRELTTEVRLANGVGSGYALGLDVALESGRRVLKHGGEVGGFTAENRVYPDDGIAIVVLTNEDATDAFEPIADELANLMLVSDSPADATAFSDAKHFFSELQRGRTDPARLTSNGRSYFSAQAIADFHTSLGALGKPVDFSLKRSGLRGGFVTRVYEVTFSHKKLDVVVRATPEGLIEQYTVSAK
jgi:D-alanyl-D-alanine carboxypeptidase